MLIADGGGGYGGTNWNDTDVRYMWSAVETQDTDAYFKMVTSGWQATAELISAHISRVSAYRDNLSTAWDPKKSKASEAYVGRLNQLIDHLNETLNATSANITAFRTVASTLSVAQIKLKPILDQYEANEKANLAWQAKKDAADAAAPKPSATPTPTPSPSPAPSPIPTKPPVSSTQQEQLNNQARAIMFDLSSAVLSGQAGLKAPKPYMPEGSKTPVDHKDDKGNNGGSGFSPVVANPAGPSGGSTRSGSYVNTPGQPVESVSPTTNSPVGQHPIGTTNPGQSPVINNPGGGPVLGGVGPGVVVSPPNVVSPMPGGVPTPGSLPGAMPGVIPPAGMLPSGGFYGGGAIAPGGLLKPRALGAPATRMAMPSGGVIGATPGSGVIGQVPSGSPGSRYGVGSRPNPVGGVIGQQGSTSGAGNGGRSTVGSRSATSGGATRSASGNVLGHNSCSARKGDRQEETTQWDPDNPWVTDEGVDPVLMPPADPGPIDPGPAIGYLR
jgi:hypothetical protein